MNYDIHDWYWLADDGRVYGTKNQQIVSVTDSDYSEWLEKGLSPTSWPRDLDGNQTDDELQTVLDPYQVYFVNLTNYAANRRWQKEQGGITVAGLPIATDDRSKQMILGARIAADANPDFTTPWAVGPNVYELSAQQIIGISNAVLAHVASCFASYGAIITGLDDGSITTKEQIDAAFDAQI